jgi:hypothetical protein
MASLQPKAQSPKPKAQKYGASHEVLRLACRRFFPLDPACIVSAWRGQVHGRSFFDPEEFLFSATVRQDCGPLSCLGSAGLDSSCRPVEVRWDRTAVHRAVHVGSPQSDVQGSRRVLPPESSGGTIPVVRARFIAPPMARARINILGVMNHARTNIV